MTAAIERIRVERVVAVLRRVERPDDVVQALVGGGIGVVEITLDAADATAIIARLRRRGDVTVVAGTVLSRADAERAVAAGAEALVSPVLERDLVGHGVPVVLGAATPTEVHQARRAGADLVKLFPAAELGPGYVREVIAPLAGAELIVTGGIDASNAAAFLAAGAVAVGVGGALTSAPDAEAAARDLVAAVAPFRK